MRYDVVAPTFRTGSLLSSRPLLLFFYILNFVFVLSFSELTRLCSTCLFHLFSCFLSVLFFLLFDVFFFFLVFVVFVSRAGSSFLYQRASSGRSSRSSDYGATSGSHAIHREIHWPMKLNSWPMSDGRRIYFELSRIEFPGRISFSSTSFFSLSVFFYFFFFFVPFLSRRADSSESRYKK